MDGTLKSVHAKGSSVDVGLVGSAFLGLGGSICSVCSVCSVASMVLMRLMMGSIGPCGFACVLSRVGGGMYLKKTAAAQLS